MYAYNMCVCISYNDFKWQIVNIIIIFLIFIIIKHVINVWLKRILKLYVIFFKCISLPHLSS